MEILDYYNKGNTIKLGSADREHIHKNDLWHREIAVWVINEKNEILIQRRSPLKKLCPNKLSTCAGHVDKDEKVEDAAVRELFEETGISVDKDELNYVDTYVLDHKYNRHFKYVYYIKTNMKLEDMAMQEEEVSELMYLSFEQVEKAIDEEDDNYTFAGTSYAKELIEKLKNVFLK